MATNQERRMATRASIIAAAHECFVGVGFEATHTDTILERAGVSRGAMYHHFKSKRDVFEAVYVSVVEDSIALSLQSHTSSKSPLEELIASCFAWLRLVRRPEVATILIEQGPQVLGWQRARDIEAKSSVTLMQNAIRRACSTGELQVQSVELTALLINALLAELALISVHRKPRVSLATQEAAVRQFIQGFARA